MRDDLNVLPLEWPMPKPRSTQTPPARAEGEDKPDNRCPGCLRPYGPDYLVLNEATLRERAKTFIVNAFGFEDDPASADVLAGYLIAALKEQTG